MPYTTLIDSDGLQSLLDTGPVALFDCRHALLDASHGARVYAAGHIPGAVFADLDRVLAAPAGSGSGRHPLPDMDRFARWLGDHGVGEGVQVVAYDDATGSTAARLWWMLRFLGHREAAVLDGGFARWTAEGRPCDSAVPAPEARRFTARPDPSRIVAVDALLRGLERGGLLLVDARAAARFEGREEPIDPVAGHIPGAINLPFEGNLATDGGFHPPDALRQRFAGHFGPVPPGEVVHYCGSGVTACHNLLAQAHAGLAEGRLYPGSWSQWCADPARPVETGPARR